VVLGIDLAGGMRPQIVVPEGVWQGSRLMAGAGDGSFTLLGCTVSPGFDFDDYETGDRATLIRDYPQHEEMIAALTRL
jgi:predicted cupin superfamily sugar epimerase